MEEYFDLNHFITLNDASDKLGKFGLFYKHLDVVMNATFDEFDLDRRLVATWTDSLRAMTLIECGEPLEDANDGEGIEPPNPVHEKAIRDLLSERPLLNLRMLWGLALSCEAARSAYKAFVAGDTDKAVVAFYDAGYWMGASAENYDSVNGSKVALRQVAARAAQARHKADPRQEEKAFVLNCWRDWQRDPSRYQGKAAFARDMLGKCEHLISQKKIEDWCREWEKSEPC